MSFKQEVRSRVERYVARHAHKVTKPYFNIFVCPYEEKPKTGLCLSAFLVARDYDQMSRESDWSTIIKNIDLPWDWKILSMRNDITLDIIVANPDHEWIWDYISMRATISDLVRFPSCDWQLKLVSCSRNMMWCDIQKLPDWDWCYKGWSRNPNITWRIVEKNIHLAWDFNRLIANPMARSYEASQIYR